jgi:hypothetical protein
MGLRVLDPGKSDTILAGLRIGTITATAPDAEELARLSRLAERMGKVVDAEAFATARTSYERPGGTTYVNRAESLLITAYRDSLPGDLGTTLRVPTGVADYYADGPDGCEIVEAKSSSKHMYVRQALSQLLDYARFSPKPVARLAALFPKSPSHDSVRLLHDYGIDCIYLDASEKFARTPAPGGPYVSLQQARHSQPPARPAPARPSRH